MDLAKSSNAILDATYRFSYPNEYTIPLAKAYYQSLQNLGASILFPDFNPKGKPVTESFLVAGTNDLRQIIKLAEQGDNKAKTELKDRYGYTNDDAPKVGQMWLAVNYVAGDLDSGQVTAKGFPATGSKLINTKPPDVKMLLFGDDLKSQVELKDKDVRKLMLTHWKNIRL